MSFYILANVTYQDIVTRNLVVDTDVGNPDNIVAVGSHIDSVPEGPGINDDGTVPLAPSPSLARHHRLASKCHSAS